MRIFLTGGSGFIGSNLIKALIEQGHSVITTGVKTEANVPSEVKFLNLGLESIDEKHLNNIDVCFHLSANNDTMDADVEEMFKSNVIDPSKLFYKLNKKGCKKFIYASSTAVYGNEPPPFIEDKTKTNPLNPYASSKLAFEEWATDFGTETQSTVIGLRYCNVYGPGEYHKGKRASMIFQLFNQMKMYKYARVFENGEQKRDWCYIKDVVNANLKCLNCKESNILNIASGSSVSFNSVISILNLNMNTNIIPEYFACNFKDRLQTDTQCDISKAKKALDWHPTYSIEKGIREYIRDLSLGSPF
jgi:ADP-L-glycero-D-manno-heptose 6-epimerase